MLDPQLAGLAEILVTYSSGVKLGDVVRNLGPPIARPPVTELYRAMLGAGACSLDETVPDECTEIKHISKNGRFLELRWPQPGKDSP